ncbi:MAG: hypothetical protein JWL75_275 [Parcubacteria group bacterium]|nr:hypothetical protein [Parcubacteria group bacterium]
MLEDYWTALESEALKNVTTYEEAAAVAISILTRMNETEKRTVQVCGPMSTGGLGSLALNMERFERAVSRAQFQGEVLVFNQMPFQTAIIRISNFKEGDPYDMGILEIFYRLIFESGLLHGVLFLDDWESSVGARWERETAAKLNMIIEDYPREWLW